MTPAAKDIYLAYYAKVSAYIRGKVDNHHGAVTDYKKPQWAEMLFSGGLTYGKQENV